MEAKLYELLLLTLRELVKPWGAIRTEALSSTRVVLLPAGDYNTGLWIPQGISRI